MNMCLSGSSGCSPSNSTKGETKSMQTKLLRIHRSVGAFASTLFLFSSLASFTGAAAAPSEPTVTSTPPAIIKGNIQIELQTVASGLTAPVDLEDAGDGSGRVFIVEQTGKIKIL